MTQKQKAFHKSLIKSLHISRRYSEFYKENREEYEELLVEHFGVKSSKELSIDKLIKLVDFMNFKDVVLPYPHHDEERASEAQLTLMKSLWESFASTPTEEALLKFVNRQVKKRYLHLHMLQKSEAQKIIPVLKTMQKNIIIMS